ncbi:hypothetical protein [Maritalea sp.]|uniref:hypothetical protein n=1 Tax=Maritalea sp. TaxID=2003361 RepID=UPI003EF0F263
MSSIVKAVSLAVLIALLAACARLEQSSTRTTSQDFSTTSSQQAIVTQPTQDFAENEILSFLPTDAVSKLTKKEKTEAASAQFFALQYGRVGAFREWSADSSARGEVSVGPYVKVNKLDCREFTHTVVLSGQRLSNTGTSCREEDGQWSVVTG